MTAPARVGIVGVGAMGLGIAQRLLARGMPLTVHDIDPARERLAARAGARVVRSPAAVARDCRIVLSVVVDARQTERVLFGRDSLMQGLQPGAVLMICSTLAPAYVASVAQRLRVHRVSVLDTPMSGGPARARAGTMSLMVAGPRSARIAARAVLAAMSNQRFEWGERVGAAAAAKITNNLLAGANLAAAAEGLALGVKLGLDPRKLLDLFAASSGQSWIGEDRLRRAIGNDYAPRATPTLLHKDLGIALAAARDVGVHTAMARTARGAFRQAIALGWAGCDDAALYPVALGRAAGARSAGGRPSGRAAKPGPSAPPAKPRPKRSRPTARSKS